MNLRTARACPFAAALLICAIPTWAGPRVEKTLKLQPGGRFVLESYEGSVTVTGSDQPDVSVVITSNRSDFQSQVDFSFEEDPGMVRVRAFRYSSWHFFDFLFDYLWLHYEVRVPKATVIEIKTGGGDINAYSLTGRADLKTLGGAIEVSHLTGDLRAFTSGGSIRVQRIQGDTELETYGGGIEAISVDGRLKVHTSGGWVRIDGVTGRVDASTWGGSIQAIFSKGNARGGVLETSGGSIYAKVDPAANLDVDASTSGGGGVSTGLPVRVAGAISPHAVRGTLGSGGELLRLHTSGGSVRLDAL